MFIQEPIIRLSIPSLATAGSLKQSRRKQRLTVLWATVP